MLFTKNGKQISENSKNPRDYNTFNSLNSKQICYFQINNVNSYIDILLI